VTREAEDLPGIGLLLLPAAGQRFLIGDCGSQSPLEWKQAPIERPAAHARYRWWIGHQATFCVWRLLSESLAHLAEAERHQDEIAKRACALYEAYSLLLLYAGSCSPEIYEAVIRPEMTRAAPAFSGRWAQDYEAIPALLRWVRKAQPPDVVAELGATSKANRIVHMALAKRLVGDAPSLLREQGGQDEAVTDDQRRQFDRFFRVRRTQICRQAFTLQLIRLYTAIVDDLDRAPLRIPEVWADPAIAGNPAMARCCTDAEKILWRLIDLTLSERALP
jgi:L-tyrosine peroxygenase